MKVLLLIVDSLRADAPGFGGGPASPTLDGLAAEGTRFDKSYCAASWTVPSLVSLLTGRPCEQVGVQRWRHSVPRNLPTLPAAFAEAGFDVRCLVPNPRWGLRTLPGVNRIGSSQDSAAVEAALRSPRGDDRLVIVHHWGTHLPYLPSRLRRSAWNRACDACVEALSSDPGLVGPKLRELYHRALGHLDADLLPRWIDAAMAGGDDVLVCVTGDHGESWGEELPDGRRVEHLFDLHGRWMTDATTRVPLLFHGLSVPARQQLGGFTRGFDVAPTLCALAGVPWSGPRAPATSLAPCIEEGSAAPGAQAVTVATANLFTPDTYLQDARAAFHRFSLRSDAMRLEVDFTEQTRRVVWGEPEAAETDAAHALLRTRWEVARDPGAVLPKEAF